MTLADIKSKVESVYKVEDITAKSRVGSVVTARRLALWYAKEKGFTNANIHDEWGYKHDIAIYHNNFVNDMIELGDRSTSEAIWECFGVDVTKDLTKEKLVRRHKLFDDLLMSCPDSQIHELRERVEIMVKAYNHKHVPQQAEIIESNALKIIL